jgi:hypothetical protein
MARNDEGEFELVLGNRQLLSGFFIVVILFGVFFTMGYIVGRHSAPPSSNIVASNQDPIPPRTVSPGSPPPGQAEVVVSEPKAAEAPPPAPPDVVSTRPATAPPEAPRPAESRPEPEATRPEPRRTGSDYAEPPAGSYLQVAAPKRTAAQGVVESLKNKGIKAVLAPGPNEDTVRVLVGPLDSSSVGKMRVDLEGAGFKPFAKKY